MAVAAFNAQNAYGESALQEVRANSQTALQSGSLPFRPRTLARVRLLSADRLTEIL